MKPEETLTSLFCFLLDITEADDILDTTIHRQIKEICTSGFKNKTAYKLKDTSSSLSRSNHMYSNEQMTYMKDELADFIKFWDYQSLESGED